MKGMVNWPLPFGSLPRLKRTTNLANLNGVEVFRIDQPCVAGHPREAVSNLRNLLCVETGVSASTLRRGFEKACDRARIPFGLTVEGGVIWHDLRRTFAPELRGRQVHEYDISDLLGHTIQSVTGIYARSTPEALEDAVNRLTEPRGTWSSLKGRPVEKSVTILAPSSLLGLRSFPGLS